MARPQSTRETIQFYGLPPALDIGSADVIPLTPFSSAYVSKCVGCRRVGPSFDMCVYDHAICPTCTMLNLPPGVSGWCPGCNGLSPATSCFIPLSVFAKLQLQCRCGFEGELPTIVKHLKKRGSPCEGKNPNVTTLSYNTGHSKTGN